MIDMAILSTRRELHDRADDGIMKMFDYCRRQGIDIASSGRHFGASAITPIVDCGAHRFEFGDARHEAVDAFVFEAFGADDESVIDLVAWRLDQPDRPMTMFGRVGLVGLSAAMNPTTFFMGAAIRVRSTALHWLQSQCKGCAVVVPDLAARQLRDLIGPIAVASVAEGRRIRALIDSIPRPPILVPSRRAA